MKQDQSVERRIRANVSNDLYGNNSIKSTSTNIITFVPVNLLFQLTDMANIYFIIIAILQVIPSISVTNGTPTILLPLAFVMLTVMIKSAYEEYSRYKKDKLENDTEVEVWSGNTAVIKHWDQLRPGDVIRVKRENMIPCDALIIQTSDPENLCYIETKGLDGETNLKIKRSFLANSSLKSKIPNDFYKREYDIVCEPPNSILKKFQGNVDLGKGEQKIPLKHDNLLLRGCILKTVLQAWAVCLYCGADTKVVLNSVKFEPKKSKLMTEVNKLVIEVFIWQLVIALITGMLNMTLESSYQDFMKYLPSTSFWIITMTWWLLMTYFVPISLMVTLQMVKFMQSIVLARDKKGYSKQYNCFVNANNTSVNQNLGQIKYVFTDKTGTLTKNKMVFKNIIIEGRLYGENPMDKDKKEEEKSVIPDKSLIREAQKLKNYVNFNDLAFKQNLENKRVQEAIRVLYLCHDIIIQNQDGQIKYDSSSPDELALINFTKLYGRELISEKNKVIEIGIRQKGGKIKKYEKLCFLEFNSDRKRMSVIVRDLQTNQIQLLSKGADSAIEALLRSRAPHLDQTKGYVDELSKIGLRTLFLAKRDLTEEEFKNWNDRLNAARLSKENKQNKLVFQMYDKIEKDLELVGATAIEDELQDDVAATIETMRLAGMSFFILTGDKRETAINIGRSCGLVGRDARLIDIPSYTEEHKKDEKKNREWRIQMVNLKELKEEKVFLLDASSIIPPDLPMHQTICYRCTPSNKENIVRHVKDNTANLTMAVGDGANDVNMITAADVGIGVKGKQGSEAARVADFVVGEFKFIRLLTLYYGREWYRKNARLVCYNFFKNWYHVSCVIAYGAFTYFSGVVIYDVYLYEMFNVFFTSWPIIIYAVFDEEYTYKESIKYTSLYAPGINNQQFNQSAYMLSIGQAILYGVCSLLIVFYTLEQEILSKDGTTGYLRLCGSVLFCSIIVIVNLKLLIMGRGLRPVQLFFVFGSIGIYWLVYYLYAKGVEKSMLVTLGQQWSTFTIFFIHLLIIFLLTFIEFGYRKYKEFSYKQNLANDRKDQMEAIFEMMKRDM